MSEFKVTRYRVRVGDEKRGPEQPFSVVLLSDLHNASYGRSNSALLQEIRSENPEAVFVAGDMLTASSQPEMDAAMALMDELTKRYPVYYANGNHEYRLKIYGERYGDCYERYSNAIKSFGVHLLENGSERIEIQKMMIRVWGLELPREYFARGRIRQLTGEQIREWIGAPDPSEYNLLLAHHPMYFDAYADWGADLTFSGHLHGGIIRLPVLGGVVSPQVRLFPRYDRGVFKRDGKKMIVSAGMGSHTINIRINNPPEMVVVDFV